MIRKVELYVQFISEGTLRLWNLRETLLRSEPLTFSAGDAEPVHNGEDAEAKIF